MIPDWFNEGLPVDHLHARSGDAEFILDSDWEIDRKLRMTDLVWRECQVPVGEFGYTTMTFDMHLRAMSQNMSDATIAEELERYNDIRCWVKNVGGIDAALHQSPILAVYREGVLTLEDGYHRFGIAVYDYRANTVRVVCAMQESELAMDNGFTW